MVREVPGLHLAMVDAIRPDTGSAPENQNFAFEAMVHLTCYIVTLNVIIIIIVQSRYTHNIMAFERSSTVLLKCCWTRICPGQALWESKAAFSGGCGAVSAALLWPQTSC